MQHNEPNSSELAVVDAHCHIDLYPSPVEIINRAEELHIRTIAVTNAPSVFFHTRDLTRECRFVQPAVGLHPELVHSHGRELEQLWPLLEQTRYVGEIGLDYVTTDLSNREHQRQVFEAIVERCAELGDKVLTIHSRRSVADVIAIVGTGFRGKAVLHWFSGTLRQLERAVVAGFYFSVNPAMIKSRSGQSLIAAMPRDRVLTETDGPFVKIGNSPAVPEDTALVIMALAKAWGLGALEAKANILQNLHSLLEEAK